MFMCIPIVKFGHTLFMDNWFSKPNLFQKFQSMQISAMGIVRCNRKNMPKELAMIKLKKSEAIKIVKRYFSQRMKGQRRYTFAYCPPNIKKITMTEVEKKRQKNNLSVTKPNIVLQFNDGMGEVDRYHQDSYLPSFSLMSKCINIYKKFFLINGYCTFQCFCFIFKHIDYTKKQKMHFSKFQLDVAEQILESVCMSE